MVLILYTDLDLSTEIELRCRLGTEEQCNAVRGETGLREHCCYMLSRSQNNRKTNSETSKA